jgi:DNA-binding transcriptional regulator YdaS (Cro superfamily)
VSASSSEHPVREWAWSRGLSMKAMARLLGVSTQSIWYWNKRRSCPTPEMMKHIERVTQGMVKPDYCIEYYMEKSND